jgi:carboxymethylenebutenolidase
MPAQGGPFPTVLVVQEVFGVHEHIKDICRRLAKAGYYAIAPELNARQGNPAKISDIQELVQKIVMKVPTDQVMSEAYAKASKADATKLAVTGFCWVAGQPACIPNPNLKAAVAWYGSDRKPTELTPKNPLDIASDVKCPVLALYGGADQSIPQETIEKCQAACKAAGISYCNIAPRGLFGSGCDAMPLRPPEDPKPRTLQCSA